VTEGCSKARTCTGSHAGSHAACILSTRCPHNTNSNVLPVASAVLLCP
jgi:hypothetical protein